MGHVGCNDWLVDKVGGANVLALRLFGVLIWGNEIRAGIAVDTQH